MFTMITWIIRRCIVGVFVMYRVSVECECNFPVSLRGSWNGADRGIMHFENSSFLTSYTSANTANLPATLDFNCFEKQENMFLLKATHEQIIFGGQLVKFYLCIEIHVVDENLTYYYQLTEYDLFIRDNIFGYVPDNIVLSDVCTRDIVPRNFIMMVKNGSIENEIVDVRCPTDIQAIFTNMTTQRYGETDKYYCSGTVFDVCTDKTMINITYSEPCDRENAKTLSIGGIYHCIHSIIEGSTTFLSIWNDDDGATQPFSCFAFQRIADIIYATETPQYCSNSSTSTVAETGGVKIVIWDIEGTCEVTLPTTTEAPVNLAGLWALLLLPALFILLFFIFLAIYCYRRHGCICKKIKFPKKKKKEPPVIDDGTGKPDTVRKITFVPSVIKPAKLYNFRPKKPLSNSFPLFDPNWNPTDEPNLQPVAKVEPLYHDTLDDYMKERLPRRSSGGSLYSFHSGLISNGFLP